MWFDHNFVCMANSFGYSYNNYYRLQKSVQNYQLVQPIIHRLYLNNAKLTSQDILFRPVRAGGGTQGPCDVLAFTQSFAFIRRTDDCNFIIMLYIIRMCVCIYNLSFNWSAANVNMYRSFPVYMKTYWGR